MMDNLFDNSHLRYFLVMYKENFLSFQWPDEKYKWEAVQCFKDNWDVNASDFADMLARSLAKTFNLLASKNNYPARTIQNFAKKAPEEVRAMFSALFEEREDVVARIIAFKDQSSILYEQYETGSGHHYQNENAISTYLWLRFPDKYYVYKYTEVKTVAEKLGSNLSFKKGAYVNNLHNFYSLYDGMCEEIKSDEELLALLKSQLTDTCYPDPEYRTLTGDVSFFISRFNLHEDRFYKQKDQPQEGREPH